MKKVLALVLVAVMALAMCVGCAAKTEDKLETIKKNGKIVMATSPDFAPSEFIDPTKTGQESYVGSDIELGKYIAAQLGVELEIQAMEFQAVQAAVTQGDVDMAISGFAYTEERAESMLLSDYFNNSDDSGQGLLVLKENADSYKTAADFAGKKVAVQNASLQYNLLTEQLPDAVPELITNLNDAIMMLITGKVDAVGVDADNSEAFAANYDEICMSEFYYEYGSEGNVLACTLGQDNLMAEINKILAQVNEQGLYEVWRDEATELATALGVDVAE